MSLNKILSYSLLILLCWIWLNRTDNDEPLPPAVSVMVVNKSPELERVANTQQAAVAADSKLQPKQTLKQCKFPILYDTQGAPFELFLSPTTEYEELNDELNLATKRLLHHYSQLLNEELVTGIRLNVLVLSPDDFESMLIGRIGDPANTLGVYFSAENLAVVKYVNFEQALVTAIHEVTHAVNFALFGHLPRFLNEGLAESAETSYLVSNTDTRFASFKKANEQRARKELMGFYFIMHSESDWHTTNNSSLYLSSSAWAYFLLNSELGVEAIKGLLQQKYRDPCQSLTPDQIIDTINQNYPNFEQEFYYWFDEL